MNFTEAVAEVVSITKRPDKLLDIRREVNKAVNFFCMGADFVKDLEEVEIPITSTEYAQNLDLTNETYFTRFRKFAYIRPTNRKKLLDAVTPNKIFAKGREQVDCYYVAGTQANFKLCKLADALYVGYFRFPPLLTDAAPTFWMLEVSPYMVIDKAAGAVFRNIGDDASSKRHDDDANVQYLVAKRDYQYGGPE